jgi:DNA invertase Pin-like site-specific DNA recombinase
LITRTTRGVSLRRTEALDMTTPRGRALAAMLAAFAEFERDILRDRVEAGIATPARKYAPMADHRPLKSTPAKSRPASQAASASGKLLVVSA